MLIVSLLLLAVLTIGAVSASEDLTTDVADDVSDESVDLSVENDLSDYSDMDILDNQDINAVSQKELSSNMISNDSEEKVWTIADLNDLIQKSEENSIVKLEHDYYWKYSLDENYSRFNITKSLTLDGQGHIIDGYYMDFNITADNVIFKNFTLIADDLYFSGKDCSIVDCNFTKVYSVDFYNDAACLINDNFGCREGLYFTGSNNSVKNCNFENGHRSRGGALWFANVNNTVIDCSFIDCYAVGTGGAIYLERENSDIINCSFVNCYVNSEGIEYLGGGAIFSSSACTISDCSFVNCYALLETNYSSGGGAIFSSSACTISDCSFVNCHASPGGGAIYFYRKNMASVKNCNFVNCSNYNNVILVGVDDFILSLMDCNFTECNGKAWSSSGRVDLSNIRINGTLYDLSLLDIRENSQVKLTKDYSLEYSPIALSADNFVLDGDNHSINATGLNGVWITGDNVTIKNINFIDSGLVFYGNNSTIINCRFEKIGPDGNLNEIQSNFCGLNYYRTKGNNIINCSFVNCYKYQNASPIINFNEVDIPIPYSYSWNAYFCEDINILGCNFINTTRLIDIETDPHSTKDNVNISNCNFIDCYGHIDVGRARISNCNFINSRSSGYGGVIYGFNCSVVGCSFINCSSESDGGAIYFSGGLNTLINCDFINCSSKCVGWDGEEYTTYGGAIYFAIFSDSNIITNCKFINNNATIGSAVFFDNSLGKYYGKVSLINTVFEGNDWYSDYPVEVLNVSVDGVVVSLWDALDDNGHVYLNRNNHISYSPICINSNNVVIDGRGYTITSTPYFALYVNAENVTIRNIDFNGSRFYSYGKNCHLENCTFRNCTGDDRSVVSLDGGKLENCNFIDCAEFTGDYLVEFLHDFSNLKASVINCNFNNWSRTAIYVSYGWNAVEIYGSNFTNSLNGRALFSYSASVDKCNFINCSSEYEGTAIYNDYQSYMIYNNITNCNFINCTSTNNGGAVSIKSCSLRDSSFINCSAKYGGAVYARYWSNHNHEIFNCRFINNTGFVKDAAIYFDDRYTPNLANSSFVGGKWFSHYSVNISNLIVDDIPYHVNLRDILDNNTNYTLKEEIHAYYSPIFIKGNNILIEGNGVTLTGNNNEIFFITGNNVTIKNVIFKKGGIYSKSENNTFINCTFLDCNSTCLYEGGGAINGLGTVINSSFINCYDTHRGGAVSGLNNVINCSFENCSTTFFNLVKSKSRNGGAVYGVNNVVNSSFVNCFVDNFFEIWDCDNSVGGAIDASKNITNCIFVNCYAGMDIGHGGAVSGGNVFDSVFVNCSASEGGAIFNGFAYNSSFLNCSAYSGAAVYFGSDGVLVDCSFVNCCSNSTGTVYFADYHGEDIANISGCSFENCSSRYSGGAIYFNDYYNVTIFNSSFINCFAKTQGGAIYFDYYANANITNCSFVSCSVDYSDSRVSSYNAGNYGCGGALYFSSYPHPNISYCNFINCSAKGYYLFNILHYEYQPAKGAAIFASWANVTNCYFSGNDADVSPELYSAALDESNNNTIETVDSTVLIPDLVFDPADSYSFNLSTRGASGISVTVLNHSEAVVNIDGNMVTISNIGRGDYVLNISTVARNSFNNVSVLANMSIKKANSSVEVADNISFGFGDVGYFDLILNGATGVTAAVVGHDEAIVDVINKNRISVSNLNPGDYVLNIVTIPDGDHYSTEVNVTFNVFNKDPSSISLSNNISFNYRGEGKCIAEYDGATGVTAAVIGHSEAKIDIVNNSIITVSNLTPGDYVLNVKTIPDENHYSVESNVTVTVAKANATISISKWNNTAVKIGVTYDGLPIESAYITYAVGNRTGNTTLSGAYLLIRNQYGNVNVNVVFAGNDCYNPCELTKVLAFKTRLNATISITKWNETAARLALTYNGSSIKNANITYSYGNVTKNRVLSTGLLINGFSGEVPFKVVFAGNDDYNPCEKSVVLSFNTGNNGSTNSSEGNTSNPTNTSEGNGTSNTNATNATDVNGTGDVNVTNATNASGGNGTGGINATNTTNETNTTVTKLSTSLTASKVTATYAVSKKLTVTLKDKNGNKLKNKYVTVKVGTISKKLRTNSNGQVSVDVSSLVPKTYTATIQFAGDSKYTASSKKVSVVIKKANPKITAKAKTFKRTLKTKKYSITLKNNKNKVMKNTKVTIKVNGKTYTAKTNAKGVATFKITKLTKKGSFKSIITYAGSKYYNKVTKTVTIKTT